jgi:hypothetical protein
MCPCSSFWEAIRKTTKYLSACAQDERFQRLVAVEDIGALAATAMEGTVGDARQFKSGVVG